jgi:uncharacterized membrane protein YdbT with pleckstrin-like domain
VALKLGTGERVIFSGHPSWRSILGVYLRGLLLSATVGAVVAVATRLTGDGADGELVFLSVFCVLALTALIGLARRLATTYTITNRRLHIKRGIIAREIQETRLERVQNVSFSQTVYQRLMQIGSVDFDTAASDDYEFSFIGVAEPEQVVASVDQATSQNGVG